ncbi:hypothetical protein [Rhizobium sp. BK251]|uniref:hypothetical protein n=1 Tax=Rhizobium sp. BK251 TaxID=2512125 RepID=UPI001050FA81|nr:hypothetical protein [Rhizobium sp. BK251]TCL74451.1 hypothetical protein EV286_10211 [Rhizobium sp. BK251]
MKNKTATAKNPITELCIVLIEDEYGIERIYLDSDGRPLIVPTTKEQAVHDLLRSKMSMSKTETIRFVEFGNPKTRSGCVY